MTAPPQAGEDDPGYLRRSAKTQAFTLGLPRSFQVAGEGSRVAFLRSSGPEDAANALWVFDVAERRERLVVDPASLTSSPGDEISAAERTRRERMGERAGGIVAYSADRDLSSAVFALSGRLFRADLVAGGAADLGASGSVYDPRADASGSKVAYVTEGALRVIDAAGDRELAADDDPLVTWGLAEFIAAEEMDRIRGFWWSPDGDAIAVTRVDESPIPEMFLADPSQPSSEPRRIRYPFAGGPNASVTLHVISLDGGHRVDVRWDRDAFPYLGRVHWSAGAPLTILVQSRDQRTTRILEVDRSTGRSSTVVEDTDPDWVELVEGSPTRLGDGRLVSTADTDDTRRLRIDDQLVTPPGLQVRSVHEVVGEEVLVAASEDPTETHVWRAGPGGSLDRLTRTPGVHAATAGGDVMVLASSTLEGVSARVLRGGVELGTIASMGEEPPIRARPSFFLAGSRELRTAVLSPDGAEPDGPLPVLLDPYGGPHHARVTKQRGQYLESQWFADRGFAVVVADGRGTPGRGTAWERSIRDDVAAQALEDQLDALNASADRLGYLDLSRVAMRGWSFGGYLTALALLRAPDVVHAGIVGAPVTDWALYDTFYSERYLGSPGRQPEVYERNSPLAEASALRGSMLLIHGFGDDNVLAANTLRLSSALTEAGKRHELYLLPNASHRMASDQVRESLPKIELAFLRRSLGLEDT